MPLHPVRLPQYFGGSGVPALVCPSSIGVRPPPPACLPRVLPAPVIWGYGVPPVTCRRYYRRIFRSGRLLMLYRALYKDLCTRGRLDLTALVEHGCFVIDENRLLLRPGLIETRQMRTALLFMQPGYHIYRHLRRENEQESRRSLPHFGSLTMDRLGRMRNSSSRPSPVQPLPPEPEFTYTPLEQLIQLRGFHK